MMLYLSNENGNHTEHNTSISAHQRKGPQYITESQLTTAKRNEFKHVIASELET